jgi:hypothetical protein
VERLEGVPNPRKARLVLFRARRESLAFAGFTSQTHDFLAREGD